MAGVIIADYELVERAGGTETMALFKGKHTLIPDRLRAVRLPQGESARFKATFRPERLKEVFGLFCQSAAQVASALDSASPAERTAATRIGFIENIHIEPPNLTEPELKDYLISEWVEGGGLQNRLNGGPLPFTETIRIVTGVLEGLEFAHKRGLVHGNLKPGNILLTAGGDPKLVDFGGNIFADGMPPRLGSVPYLSPEQMEPGAELDGCCDLFSLTLILYTLLTGRIAPRLFSGGQMPSRINPLVPAGFDEIIVQGLQTDPRSRFRSAAEMLDRIRQSTHQPAAEQPHTQEPAVSAVISDGTTQSYGVAAAQERPVAREADRTAVVVMEPEAPPVTEAAPAASTRQAGERRMNDVDGAEMLWAPGGELSMGSERTESETPVHPVAVPGYWIYRHPITQGQYLKFLAHLRNVRGPESTPPRPSLFKRGDEFANRVAAGIRWSEAQEYAKWAGARLPTEAEWEWAARGSAGSRYPWGDAWEEMRANTAEAGLHEPTDVDRFYRGESWCGAQDLVGNVWEWCSSLFKPYPYNAQDGREDLKQSGHRVLRGGAANTSAEEATASCRCIPSSNTAFTGFRLVRSEGNEQS